MRRARLFSLIVCIALPATALPAQWQVAGDLGASRLQRTNIPQSNAVTLGGSVTAVGERSWLRSNLLGVVAGSNQLTAQGLMAGSLLGPSGHLVRGELNGVVSAFSETGGPSTVSGEVMPRAQFGAGPVGGALGLGFGVVSHDGIKSPLYHAAADAWWAVNDDQFVGAVSVVRLDERFNGVDRILSFPRSYLDLIGSWRHDRGGFVIGASGGARAGIQTGTRGGAWGSAEMAAWVSPRSAVVLSAGRSLDDPMRGIPRTTFFGVALRLTGQRHVALSRRSEVAGARVSITRVDDARRRIEVRGLTASRVELMGDFTDWTPVTLEAAGDIWRLERAISSGLHRIALRIDGGEWIAPANLPRASDDLGGVVGLITIP